MALDPRYITGVELEDYFVDKSTGFPLAGGIVSFWKDNNRTVPKLVYQLSGAPPNYTYTPLPDPIILSSVGTFQDSSGNNVAVYYYPYDDEGNLELYYVTVTDSFGNVQFTREAWPYPAANQNPASNAGSIENELSNPQFALVSFIPSSPLVINFAGAGTTSVQIAPDWTLNITSTGAGSLTVTRTSIAGVTAYPYNPPYTLTITPGLNISGITLSQRLNNNPNIWSPQAGATNGYVATSILLAPLSSVTIQYAPSTGAAQTLLTANNLSGVYEQFDNTIQLTPPTNTDNSNVGYVDIILNLPTGMATTFSNVQVVGLDSNIQNVPYDQTPVNRQIDHLFNYFNSLLQFKPIPSYLIGWDFPQNPAQFLGSTLAASAAGANTSRYVWDQTIVFQTTNSGPAISRGNSGSLRITATNATQFALIQYLPQADARQLLHNRLSVNVSGLCNFPAGLPGTISLWYTTDVSLPSCAANNSIVATLDANGKPATFNGNWTEVGRSNLGDARFTIQQGVTNNFFNYGFSGWDLLGGAGANTATFFAIVIGFSQLPITNTVDFNSISLVAGDIPTIPAPTNGGETLRKCQGFYEKSFDLATIPAQAAGVSTVVFAQVGAAQQVMTSQPYKVTKNSTPTVTTYNPTNANAQVYDITIASDTSNTNASSTLSVINITFDPAGGSATGNTLAINWTSDCRLGK